MIKNINSIKILFKINETTRTESRIPFLLLSFLFLLILSNNKVYSQDYAAEVISVDYGSSEWCMGESRNVTLKVKNIGTRTWYATGTTTPCTNTNLKVAVSFKWNADADFNTYTTAPFSSRNPIPNDVAPGATVTVKFPVRTPLGDPVGTNNLSINLMAQECQWFSPVVYTSPNLTIRGALNPGTISNKQTICHGETAALLTGTLPTGGNGIYTYQWQTQANCIGLWTDATGSSTSADYQPGVLTQNTCFRRKVVSDCGTAYSKPVTLTSDLRLYYSFDKQLEPTNNILASSFDVTFESQILGVASGFTNQLGIGNILGVSNTQAYQGSQSIHLNRGTTPGVDVGNILQTTPVSLGEFTSFSTWAYSTIAGPFIQLEYNGGSYSGTVATSNIHSGTGWEYLTVSFPTAAVSATTCSYSLFAPNYNSDTYWDNIQLEKKNHSTPFYAGIINTATVLDLSGNGYHGTIQSASAPSWVENGFDGGAYDYNGLNSIIDMPNDLGYTTQASAFAWFKNNGTSGGSHHVIMGGPQLEISIPNSGGAIRAGVTTTNGRVVYNYGSNLNDGKWHHLGVTMDGTTKRAYIDGVLVGTETVTGTLISNYIYRRLGRWGNDSYYWAKGIIDEVRVYSKALTTAEVKDLYDAKSLKITLPVKSNVLATNAQTATCKVKGSNWIHFHEPFTGNLIGSVNANGGDLGDVTLTAGVNPGGAMFACNTGSNPAYHTAYMGRNWHVTSSTYPSSANFPANASIRLPYADGELTAMNGIASITTLSNSNDDNATAAQVMLTKISGGSVDGNPTNDCTATILGIPQNTSGTIASAYSGLTIAGKYADFSVGQFSEMFLHKNFKDSPLPVKLTNFSANCENNATLSWITASEQNSDRFIVEKSRDGQTWNWVATQTAAGTSNTIINYTQTDENNWNGVTYYRLRQIDFNGAEEIYGPISVTCKGNESSMTVYPNPNNGSFTIEIHSETVVQDASLILMDLTGKTISTQSITISSGTSLVLFENFNLQNGTYFIQVNGKNQNLKPLKVTVSL